MSEYVIERVLGVYIYCGVIFSFFFLIRQSKGLLQLRNLLCIYTVVLTALAFLYVPSKGADVSRLILTGNGLVDKPWDEFLEWISETSTPIAFIYMRFLQSLNINGAMSGITAFITMSLIFSSVYTVAKKLNISNWSVSYYILFLMCGGTFFGAIAGVRFALATAIMANGLIALWYGKRNYLRLAVSMVVPCLIHTGMVPMLAFGALTLFLRKNLLSHFGAKILILLLGVASINVMNYYVNAALDKYDIYAGTGATFGTSMYIFSIVSFVIYLGFIVSAKKNGFLGILHESNKWMLVVLSVFEIFVIRDFVVFARYQYVYPLLLMPYLLCYAEKDCRNRTTVCSNTLLIICLLKLVLGYLGGMSGMKFFVL